MTRSISLAIETAASRSVSDLVRAVVATLPQTFTIVDERASAVAVAVDGAGAWPDRALDAIRRGARAVLVVNPSGTSPASVAALLETEVPVVLDSAWRHSAALVDAAPLFQALDGAGRLLECRTTVRSADQLRKAARSLAFAAQALIGGRLLDVRDVVDSPGHLLALASTTSGLLVRVSAVVGPEPTARASFRLVGSDAIAKLTLPAPDSGDTGVVEVVDDTEKRVLPSAFESSHRSTLRYLQRVIDGTERTSDLAEFSELNP